jgi:hypothetical protein
MKSRCIWLLAPLVFGGCAPNVQALLQAKHYREAVCAAHDGGSYDEQLVGQALDLDADVHVNVHAVSDAELQPILGLDTPAASSRGRLVRVNLQSNVLPVDDIELEAGFFTEDEKVAAVPADWDSLAWMTNEKLPAKHVSQTYLTYANLGRLGFALVTIGISTLFTEFEPEKYLTDAPLEEFEQRAPDASALHRTTEQGGCKGIQAAEGTGKRCTSYFILDSVSKSPVSMQIQARYVSFRQTGKREKIDEERCVLPRSVRLPLGTPQEIEKITRERFGDRMLPVGAVVRAPK